ncbi:MAG: NAD(P)H-hydrate epimerase [Neisseriaceae bacterium]|nr:NAD(P)H-hydrate epimerase [Neisseriaceae bacterium]
MTRQITYTAFQMRKAEEDAVKRGIPLIQLMENAGRSAAFEIMRELPTIQQGLMICGSGNNAGDALVMARILSEYGVSSDVVFMLDKKLSDLSQENLNKLPQTIRILKPEQINLSEYDFFVDAVFGTGFKRELPENIANLFKQINQITAIRLALDVPSGLNCDTGEAAPDTFRAQITYAFGGLKPAHIMPNASVYCGDITCLDIGIFA